MCCRGEGRRRRSRPMRPMCQWFGIIWRMIRKIRMGTLLYKIKSDWNRCLFEREIEMQCILPSDCNTNIGILCRYYNRGTKKCMAVRWLDAPIQPNLFIQWTSRIFWHMRKNLRSFSTISHSFHVIPQFRKKLLFRQRWLFSACCGKRQDCTVMLINYFHI